MHLDILKPRKIPINIYDHTLSALIYEESMTEEEAGLELRMKNGQITHSANPLIIRHNEIGQRNIFTFRYLTPKGEQQHLIITESTTFYSTDQIPKLTTGDIFIFPAELQFQQQSEYSGAARIIIENKCYALWDIPPQSKITIARLKVQDDLCRI